MKQTEAQVQAAIIEALVFDGWLIIRVNQGGAYSIPNNALESGPLKPKRRYITFANWRMLGQEQTDKGIADVIAMKYKTVNVTGYSEPEKTFVPTDSAVFLAVEVKAPGRKSKATHAQQQFLDAVEEHGGIGIVVDSVEDIQEYLDRAEVQ